VQKGLFTPPLGQLGPFNLLVPLDAIALESLTQSIG
jgi:hypothetical protein